MKGQSRGDAPPPSHGMNHVLWTGKVKVRSKGRPSHGCPCEPESVTEDPPMQPQPKLPPFVSIVVALISHFIPLFLGGGLGRTREVGG